MTNLAKKNYQRIVVRNNVSHFNVNYRKDLKLRRLTVAAKYKNNQTG